MLLRAHPGRRRFEDVFVFVNAHGTPHAHQPAYSMPCLSKKRKHIAK